MYTRQQEIKYVIFHNLVI